MSVESLAEWLRAQRALTGAPPPFEVDAVPDDPIDLFREWIEDAVRRGVPEPHAGSLATVDADGVPDARTLILKDVSAAGWAFASERSSRKGAQLLANPAAALNFWWQPIVRAVRVRGVVVEASPAESEADLARRSPAARSAVAPGDWTLWRIVPSRVEFWQGSPDRRHVRVVYEASDGAWSRTIPSTAEQRERGEQDA
jgi:pyridoxamine 5'-phosphate oxidase